MPRVVAMDDHTARVAAFRASELVKLERSNKGIVGILVKGIEIWRE